LHSEKYHRLMVETGEKQFNCFFNQLIPYLVGAIINRPLSPFAADLRGAGG